MLGLILIYFIGKYFYQLAEEYNKSKWGFAILAVVTYYAGTFIFGLLFGIFLLSINSNFLETAPNIVISLIALPFGLLACYILYISLKKVWEKERDRETIEIDQIGNNSID